MVIAALVSAACAAAPQRPPPEVHPIAGLEAAVKPGTLAVFGEIHGTAEVPAFIGDAACALARTGRVHVGFELPSTDTSLLDSFLASGDERPLRESKTWSKNNRDGRTSQAMLALLRKLREARAAGLPVDIFFFDDFERLGVERRDEAMAQNIAAERARAPADTFLIEVGNYHAKSSPGAPWDAKRAWMASYLKAPGVLTFDVSAPPGSAWICASAEAGSCGVSKSATNVTPSNGPSGPALVLQPLDGYDGTFQVESLTASPPAVSN